jgi:tRNA (guanine26-N2/guanine27-N2)-dimethyltransferase
MFIASRYVIANDLSASAVAAMRRNVEINGLGISGDVVGRDTDSTKAPKLDETLENPDLLTDKVRINQGDAWCAFSWALLKEHIMSSI